MKPKEKIKRYIVFLIGLFISAFGVSFITKANLGTSPITSIPYVLSLGIPLSLGAFTFIFSMFLLLLQLIILRKNFKSESWLQIPVIFLFSVFIDLTMYLLRFMTPSSYIVKLIYLLIGCVILGSGVYGEILADVVMLPGESIVNAISITWHTDFGKTKVAVDAAMSVTAGLISLLMFHTIQGVREGTIIASLLVGTIARFLNRKFTSLPNRLFNK